MPLEPWQWAVAVLGAFLAGMSKTGITGLGILCVALLTNALPAKAATGLVLPLLLIGDVYAVATYHRHTSWRHLWRLFPWTALGVLGGALALGHLNDAAVRRLIGAIILAMFAVHVWRRWRTGRGEGDEALVAGAPPAMAVMVGVLAGFTTQVANAAGPVMVLYLLAMRLPKLEFIGTGAVFFLCLNLFKVPFMAGLGLITPASLAVNALLAPAVLAGAFAGRWLVRRINQRWFELIVLGLTLVAGLKLLF
jgi:uncharacterized protein